MRKSTIFILALLLLWTTGAVALSVAVYRAASQRGMFELTVRDHDSRLHVRMPAAIAGWAMLGLQWEGRHLRFGNDFHDWTPALRAALQDLEQYEHVPLLEVDSGRERVRVEKRGDAILLRIEDGAYEVVSISMPAETLQRVLGSARR